MKLHILCLDFPEPGLKIIDVCSKAAHRSTVCIVRCFEDRLVMRLLSIGV